MKHWFSRENLRPILLALIILGIVGIIFGFVQFVSMSQRLEGNLAYQIQSSGQTISPDNAEAQMLMASDIEMRAILLERSRAVVLLGVGVVLLSVGWLGNDFLRKRQPAGEAITSS
ncbi:MAG: hypothetical protein JNM70_17750 [Anaerolineae bacterium]|nr:hypothetical protein [Anaerolineae bacterium]